MARKPNYGQQRAEVNRAKQARREEKRREREAEVEARRRAAAQAEEGQAGFASAPPADGDDPQAT